MTDLIQMISANAGYFIFILFMFYGQRLQMLQMSVKINAKLKQLSVIRDKSFAALRTHLQKYVNLTADQEARIKVLINSIAIPPVSHLDPIGIVPKMEHTYKTYDRYLKSNILRIVPSLKQSEVENLENSLEVAIELNVFHKIVEHFIKVAKKSKDMLALWQVAMVLPMIMDMAEALSAAADHFGTGMPIGDGFGPMVASRLSIGAVESSTDTETSVKELSFENHRLIVVKAKGPGGSVGNPGKAVQQVIYTAYPKVVITIDAGLRLESETTGEVSEGVGVAMGGPGMDRFRIEASLAEYGIPVYTLVCKMSMKEAISQMPKSVADQVDPVVARVKQMIRDYASPEDVVLVVGVGNSMGVE